MAKVSPPKSERLTLLILDQAPMRLGIRMALDDAIDVCAETSDPEQAIRSAKRLQPDLCLIGTDVAEAWVGVIRGICRAAPNAAVVVLTRVSDQDDMLRAVRAGAIGYVPGALNADRLRRVVCAAASYEAVVPRSMVRELLLEVRGGGGEPEGLTARAGQVLSLLRRGHTTMSIARQLNITPVTVRRHVSELVRRLGVADRAALIDPDPQERATPTTSASSSTR
jgi:DNA-binding NarL/FixJ family response regulator